MDLPQNPPSNTPQARKGWVALTPMLLLAALMVAFGLLAGDFSKVSMAVVFLFTSVASLLTLRGHSLEERIKVFSHGAGNSELLLMIWIFVLAGAFASSAKAMGAVTATVDLTLRFLPGSALLAGLFLASCIVSLCIGTSVGTIVALVPMASELSARTGTSLPLIVAAVVGGSFFGDNLSFISDTTVVATRTQGCSMRDKFRTNFRIVLPAAVACFIIYVWVGLGGQHSAYTPDAAVDLWRIAPYALVLVTALLGVNVLVVLLMGIAATGAVGMAEGCYGINGWVASMAEGIGGMGELILISMMAGGLLAVVRRGGGIAFIVNALTSRVKSRRGAEVCISLLVAFTNCCTANNTVAILSVGGIAKDISERYGVDKRRAASLLDIFSCIVQGIIPYGAQMLMAAGLAAISPMEIIPNLYYPMLLIMAAAVSIALTKSANNNDGKKENQ